MGHGIESERVRGFGVSGVDESSSDNRTLKTVCRYLFNAVDSSIARLSADVCAHRRPGAQVGVRGPAPGGGPEDALLLWNPASVHHPPGGQGSRGSERLTAPPRRCRCRCRCPDQLPASDSATIVHCVFVYIEKTHLLINENAASPCSPCLFIRAFTIKSSSWNEKTAAKKKYFKVNQKSHNPAFQFFSWLFRNSKANLAEIAASTFSYSRSVGMHCKLHAFNFSFISCRTQISLHSTVAASHFLSVPRVMFLSDFTINYTSLYDSQD